MKHLGEKHRLKLDFLLTCLLYKLKALWSQLLGCLFFLPWYVVSNVYWMKSHCRIKSLCFFWGPLVLAYTQLCSVFKLCPALLDPMDRSRQASLSFTISQCLLKFISVESLMLSNHLILCGPLLLPSVFPSIGVFSNELVLRIRWLEYWSCSFSPFNEFPVLISFRIDWFDLLAVQGTLKSLPQHHSSKAYQFLGTQPSLWCNSHIRTWLLENHSFDYIYEPLSTK